MALNENTNQNTDNFISIREIAKKAELSEGYLEQLFILLKKHKIVSSIKGTKGGYMLRDSADQLTVGNVLRAAEGSFAPVKCLEGELCNRREFCISRGVWIDLKNQINSYIDEVTIKQVCGHYTKLSNEAIWDFVI